MAVDECCGQRDSYRRLIARLWGFYGPLEAVLARFDWPEAEALVHRRAKIGWLANDLQTLGFSQADLGMLPTVVALPTIESVADVFGVLYVVEGATLGGQVILSRITASLGVDDRSGARFFTSYGSDVGAMWREFLSALEHFGQSPQVSDRIERAALGAFESLRTWMEYDSAAELFDGRGDVS